MGPTRNKKGSWCISMKIQVSSSILSLYLLYLCLGCSRPKDFNSFLADEVSTYGGKANSFTTTNILSGYWTYETDRLGAKIEITGINFKDITNNLAQIYGLPRFYCPATSGLGPTYFYEETNAGVCVCIFVCADGRGAQVCILNPNK